MPNVTRYLRMRTQYYLRRTQEQNNRNLSEFLAKNYLLFNKIISKHYFLIKFNTNLLTHCQSNFQAMTKCYIFNQGDYLRLRPLKHKRKKHFGISLCRDFCSVGSCINQQFRTTMRGALFCTNPAQQTQCIKTKG